MNCLSLPHRSISCRATVLICGLSLLCILGTATALYSIARTALIEEGKAEVGSIAIHAEEGLSDAIDHAIEMVTTQVTNPEIMALIQKTRETSPNSRTHWIARENLSSHLAVWTGVSMPFTRFLVVDGNTGQVIAATDPSDAGKTDIGELLLQEGRVKPGFHQIYPTSTRQKPAMFVSAPMLSDMGEIVAIVAAQLSQQLPEKVLRRDWHAKDTLDIYLVSSTGFLASSPRFLAANEDATRQFDTSGVKTCVGGQTTQIRSLNYGGTPVFGVYRWLRSLRMCLVTEIDGAEILKPVNTFMEAAVVLGLTGLAIAMIVSIALARGLVRPISNLTGAMERVSAGDQSVRVDVGCDDEIGHLAQRFNEMTDNLASTETRLRKSEERFALAMHGANDGVWDWNLETGEVYFSPRWKSMLGCGEAEIATDSNEWRSRLHPDDLEKCLAAVQGYLDGKLSSFEIEFRMRHKDGHYVDILSRAHLVRDEAGRPKRLAGTHVDISERKRIEDELRKLSRAVEQSPSAVIITDSQGVIEYVNPKFTEITGYGVNEALGKTPQILKSGETEPAEYEKLWKGISAAREWRGVFHNKRKDGTYYWGESVISPIRSADGTLTHFIGIQKDISRQLETEGRLKQSEKMESLGNLAGGIAHDFNNMLLPIQSLTSMTLRDLPPDSSAARRLEKVLEASQRAADLVKRILGFSRSESMDKEAQDLKGVVSDAVVLLRSTIPSTISIDERTEDVGTVVMDRAQIQTVVLNLASNAADAIEGKPGNLGIRLSQVQFDEPFVAHNTILTPGDYAKLSVSDDGSGMDAVKLERIFDPFFTTKAVGEGTGLGLSMVHGIIGKHDGAITVSSTVGQGTTFEIYLPVENQTTEVAG